MTAVSISLVDSHCHLPVLVANNPEGGLEPILQRAREAGVARILCASIDLETVSSLLDISRKYNWIHSSVGVHPNSESVPEPSIDDLVNLAQQPEVVAIGETGLDYYRSQGDMEWQRERFRRHIRCARTVGKPLIIHTRNAREDTLKVLSEEKAHEVGGIMHCFTEDINTAICAMECNFYISFSGIVTFRNAVELQAVAREIPMDRMLIETDAPYLAPVPHRGKTNEPAYVKHVAAFLANLRGMELEEFGKRTTDNFCRLFGITDNHASV